MFDMIDGLKLDRLAGVYLRRAENAAAYERECRKTVGRKAMTKCEGGCGMLLAGSLGPCSDCLRLVADTLRDAAGRADK